ncbi:MAG TPA: hypothetical protein VGJ73_08585 [Verrucomicrobiae bacterium]
MKFYIVLATLFASLASFAVIAETVPSPPGNIVQNGTFGSLFSDWAGLVAIVNNPNAPNGVFGLGGGPSQTLETIPGQQYSLVFYAAADLYFGPSVTLDINLNNQTLVSYETPPYSYNNGINRYDQMHWESFTNTFTATSDATAIQFADENTYDFGLAAVSVVPAPEPPASLLLSMAGIVCIFFGLRRRSLKNC